MEHVVYLDDFFKYLEDAGIDTSLINVVDYEIDIDYVFENDELCDPSRIIKSNFINQMNGKSDNLINWDCRIFLAYLKILLILTFFSGWNIYLLLVVFRSTNDFVFIDIILSPGLVAPISVDIMAD